MTMLKDSMSVSARNEMSLGQPLSVAAFCLDEETRRFLNLVAGTAPLFHIRSHIGNYRTALDQDSKLEQLGDPPADVCIVDFDQDRRSAAMLAERIHSSLP